MASERECVTRSCKEITPSVSKMVEDHYNFFYPHPACVLRRYKTLQTAPSPFQCNEPSPVLCSEPEMLHLRMTYAREAEEEKEAAATSLAHLPVTPTEQHNPGCLLLSSSWPLAPAWWTMQQNLSPTRQAKEQRVGSHRRSAFN